MTDYRDLLEEYLQPDTQIVEYTIPDDVEVDHTVLPLAIALQQGDRVMVCLVGWGVSGPYVDVLGFVDGKRIPLSTLELADTVNVRHG